MRMARCRSRNADDREMGICGGQRTVRALRVATRPIYRRVISRSHAHSSFRRLRCARVRGTESALVSPSESAPGAYQMQAQATVSYSGLLA